MYCNCTKACGREVESRDFLSSFFSIGSLLLIQSGSWNFPLNRKRNFSPEFYLTRWVKNSTVAGRILTILCVKVNLCPKQLHFVDLRGVEEALIPENSTNFYFCYFASRKSLASAGKKDLKEKEPKSLIKR